MLTSRDLAVLRAALMFFDEEMSPHGPDVWGSYFDVGQSPQQLGRAAAELRERLATSEVRYVCCNVPRDRLLSPDIFEQADMASRFARGRGGNVATLLIEPTAASGELTKPLP